MKRSHFAVLLIAFSAITLFACSTRSTNPDLHSGNSTDPNATSISTDKNAMPVLTFENDFHDFGTIKEGERVTYAFKFKNTGKSVLILSNVGTSCGCTVSSYPKQPIKPGEGSTIDISFNSEGKHGLQSKTITVYSNSEPPTAVLRIQSQVVAPDDI